MALPSPFRVLSVCAGVGGLDLGIKLAVPGARTVGYVEREAYAAAVLVARMEDAALDSAPLWDDVATFDGRPWCGAVDCITGGIPCQPFSAAGQRRGITDDRWLWPDVARIVREVEPAYVFLENVPGFVRHGLAAVLGDLAALGFDAEWGLLSAAAVGAPHKRERFWLLAHATGQREREPNDQADAIPECGRTWSVSGRGGDQLGDSEGERWGEGRTEPIVWGGRCAAGDPGGDVPLFPPGPDDLGGWADCLVAAPGTQPSLRRDVDGIASRVDRLRAAGNGVVPLVAAAAFRTLYDRLTGDDQERETHP